MGKRVNIDGPGDDPNEYWFECPECEGNGRVDDDATGEDMACPDCNGLGFYEGTADDVDD